MTGTVARVMGRAGAQLKLKSDTSRRTVMLPAFVETAARALALDEGSDDPGSLTQ